MNKLFLFLFGILLIGSVSALSFEVDNVKYYDSITKTATIKNSFGFGDTIASIKLETNQIELVPYGYSKVAEFTIDSSQDYTEALKQVDFYDIQQSGLRKRTQQFDYRIKTPTIKTEELTEKRCNVLKNNSLGCSDVVIGTREYVVDEWLPYTNSDVTKGKITIGIFTYVNKGDYVEWIPTLFGEEIKEWAIYLADPSLYGAFLFNETSGTFTRDQIYPTHNLTVNSGFVTNGRSAGALNLTQAAGTLNANLSTSFQNQPAMSSVVFMNRTGNMGTTTSSFLIGTGDTLSVNGDFYIDGASCPDQNTQLAFGVRDSATSQTTCFSLPANQWTQIGWSINSTTANIYLNGTLNKTFTLNSFAFNSKLIRVFSSDNVGSHPLHGVVVDELYLWNTTRTPSDFVELYGSGTSPIFYPFGSVSLTSPTNNSAVVAGQTFNATYLSGNATNATRYLYTSTGTLISTNFTDNRNIFAGNKTNFTIPSLSDGNYLWNIQMCDSSGTCAFGRYNYTISIDSSPPAINIVSPTNQTYIYSFNSTNSRFNLNVSATDTINVDKVWFNTSYNSTISFINNNVISQLNLTNIFGLQTIFVYSNDTSNNVAMNQTSIYLHRNYFNNQTTFETASQNYSLELWNLTVAPDIYILNYNGTNYTSTLTNVGNNKYTLNNTIDVPTGSSIKSFFYYFNDTQFRTTDTLNQTVNYSTLGICNSTLTAPFLNISFKNETVGQEVVNASITSAEFNYYIGSGTIVKNYSFVSTSENRSYTLCFSPITANITISESIDYLNSVSPQREYNTVTNAGNTTKQQTLYLLPTIVGQYVTFQIINPALQPISNVTVNVSTSSFGLIETKTTDASGAVTFFLNPLVTYTIVASKTGLTNYETSITPTQTEYTLTMGAGTTETVIDDYFRGIDYSIYPSQTYLANSTTYTFNFTISSDYWNLDSFGITLTNSSGSVFGSNSSTSSSGGTVSLTRNTGDNNTLILKPYWIIDGNTTNISKIYVVYDSSGSDTSLANLRDRIRIYIDAGGFFGLTAFGLNILVFLCIFITTGIISYKFGFTSPFAVFGIMLVLTMMFDQVNFITYADGLPEDAATILVAILTLAFGIKEATN